MSNHITLPPQWTTPKFGFLQRVKFNRTVLDATYDELGTIIGLEYQAASTAHDLEIGWWYHIGLDEDSPWYDPDCWDIIHEDKLTLIKHEEAA